MIYKHNPMSLQDGLQMYSVSAAACNPKNPGSTYEEKRDQWLRDCFHAERRQE